jgi:hypothetical protein
MRAGVDRYVVQFARAVQSRARMIARSRKKNQSKKSGAWRARTQ